MSDTWFEAIAGIAEEHGAKMRELRDKENKFRKDLSSLLNQNNKELESNTPDHVLGDALIGFLDVLNDAIASRDNHTQRVPFDYENPLPYEVLRDDYIRRHGSLQDTQVEVDT